jgi:hypothetical protein
MVYLIGSLRNPQVPIIANQLRVAGFDVFDDWYAAGPEADDKWRDYEKQRGRTLPEALKGYAARNVFAFDRTHLERARAAVLVLPAGKSAHLELGWVLGQKKPGFVLLDKDPDRFDVMYQFATKVVTNVPALIAALEETTNEQHLLARPKRDCATSRSVGMDCCRDSRCLAWDGNRDLRAGERARMGSEWED